MNISLSPSAPDNLVSRDGLGCPVPRQPAHLHTQAESGAYLRDPSRFPRRRPFIHSNRHTPSGVEFDDPVRGKHDGSVEKPNGSIQRYFSCIRGGSGSFLKAGKFSTGVSMVEALRKQYVDVNAPLVAPENLLPDAYASTARGGKKAIEFHGETKIRRHQQVDTLDHCTLREAKISVAGDLSELSEAAAAFVHVDLKANLLSEWQQVGLIASQIPVMEVLSIGGNKMKHPDTVPPSIASGTCSRLRVLEMTSCGITSWSQVAMLSGWAPSLEELCAADNDLSDVLSVVTDSNGKKVEGFSCLRLLDLSETRLASWDQVMCFSGLPVLASLFLNHNRIEDVHGDIQPPAFAALEAIALSGNRVERWGAVDRLNGLPALQSLRFSGNPVTAGLGASEARVACIARVSKLRRVNGSECGPRERMDAEKTYLRGILQELDRAQRRPDRGGEGLSKEEAERQVSGRHSRYRELWALHGESVAMLGRGSAAGEGKGNSSMASSMVQVTLTSLASASCTMEPLKKRLPASMTVGKLKQMCKRLFKVDTDQQILSYRPEPASLLSTLDDDDKPLSYFGVVHGSEVLMNEVDEKARARQQRRTREEDEERLAEQLRHADNLDAIKRGQVALDTASAQLAAADK
ncbi:unnamed protein product [Ascophyllum nodosum]